MKRFVLPTLGLAGVLVLAGCLETMPGPDRPHRPRPEKPAMCTREYAPVCAVKRGKRQTFSNACMAQAKGYNVIEQRPCGR
ncbi:subtilase-type protease inhibitor [Novosphingobium kaempferiae]|uniref:subtilase-type protease inhibitor n=1 Tax=Novosphingobium kaempferiae TaxID=2896849 RepID=UPI001E2C77D5|nr:subtilase-type protease inhibitor [Novosphingobium kaempferiae]